MSEQIAEHKMFFPQYRKGKLGVELFEGTILEHAQKLGIAIDAEEGEGICGKCVVRIERGEEALSPRTEAEQKFNLSSSQRLACQAKVVKPADIYVYIKSAGSYAILSESVQQKIEVDPLVHCTNGDVVWSGPQGQRVLGHYQGSMYGLALDVGTTTLVCQLLDLETGQQVATLARKNPQAAYGDDVISRIDHTMRHENGLEELQAVVIEATNELVANLIVQEGVNPETIYEAVVVGNPTMRNLFLGLEVESLGVIPFEPPSKEPVNVTASTLGLQINPEANVYGAALIGGHAGADCLADIIAARLHKAQKPCLLIDIGTNGEVAVGNANGIMSTSCAAGGAYEGATVGSGVGAVAGAISNIRIDDGRVWYETIGGKAPVGICGSGLIDLLAELLKAGIMTKKAKLSEDFSITDSIRFTQQDVYQLITAKAGLRTDQDLLLKYYGVTPEQIDKIYLAGAFGNYIQAGNAVAIGLLPDLEEKVIKIGNAALAGAAEMLLSRRIRQDSELWAAKIEHTKPNEREPEFQYMIADNMYF